ncbi:hypothetical protein RISK_003648 [Rhodopirellula islandica]|uniref:Uncharacterized protein n=1 Tax=Rhodopirellula islandica TaxID=595434 RepID=A0A0J1BBP4_RHOIS|nr:hypothetical protein RISK_003648 [Rhodopirellula islandica]
MNFDRCTNDHISQLHLIPSQSPPAQHPLPPILRDAPLLRHSAFQSSHQSITPRSHGSAVKDPNPPFGKTAMFASGRLGRIVIR